MTDFAPTGEQQTARDLFATRKSLVIEAGAGTGKTATLKLLALDAQEAGRRGQYIAFNKAIVTEAKAKMPSNIACSTAHGLAYRNVIPGTRFGARLENSRRMKSSEIANRLGIDAIRLKLPTGEAKNLARGYLAGLTMRAVTRFCQTADAEPSKRHVPFIDGIDQPLGTARHYPNNDLVARALEPAIRKAWDDLTSDEGQLPFKHDHYLKMWQLSGPKINADFILFDEAQDANPVLVDIVRQQRHAQLVWVGDSQQQIYSFTGAVNAMQEVGAEQTAMLSQSFRFGPAIADAANQVLTLLPDAKIRLKGTPTINSKVAPVHEPDVVLCRTNARAVRYLLDAIKDGQHPHIVGGGAEVLAFAKGAKALMDDGFTAHPELSCFETWGEVQEYVDQDEQGGDLRLLVGLIDEFGVDTILGALERMPREADADVVISTAHKSKGREWETVLIADDFPAEPKGEELRLLYVAVTRAKLTLDATNVLLLTGGFDGPPEEHEVSDGSMLREGVTDEMRLDEMRDDEAQVTDAALLDQLLAGTYEPPVEQWDGKPGTTRQLLRATFGFCANHDCQRFEHRVPASPGDTCPGCQQALVHESGLTFADAAAREATDDTPVAPTAAGLPEPQESHGEAPVSEENTLELSPADAAALARFYAAGWRIADDGDPYRPEDVPAGEPRGDRNGDWLCSCGRKIHGNAAAASHMKAHRRRGHRHTWVTGTPQGVNQQEVNE